MFCRNLALTFAAFGLALGLPQSSSSADEGPISGTFSPNGTDPGLCTAAYRLAGAKQIVFAYNRVAAGQSAAAFERVPFGEDCHTYVDPLGSIEIPVAVDSTSTFNFFVATREVYSSVTASYNDYGNGTTVIHAKVTLGALHTVTVPVTFSEEIVINYDTSDCLMEKIQIYASFPISVAGVTIQPSILNSILGASDLDTAKYVSSKE